MQERRSLASLLKKKKKDSQLIFHPTLLKENIIGLWKK